ncbi:Dephospho-CoA kinase OS=Tsukamurella paurometabola (strain ATCC 8368 / DSM / CCUG 35730 / CIP 100753 / JCM 10117 / KCTC 9821 / NBRC 16120 / NCIMB 702349/ NCTC 13040) OX=521096 GN=coaE PE=3 SV=1 [Tsukamurella paurometabola]|uniref:Dephospho-CoA kinase n=1 Tax=Tsukamurella paurometabola (strain ATCC 8368 / DSM 20162 / CCUG 35730 / CIP 100753 / JCM 10117 / KCTC 9821 / NBRC 16120 / NCIMB 702349 / NCTC 13040) TaxID=521096 RepID=D5UR49_TSUPD|nr:dephospho-CoA kinase [Tsukamurella paurometabola]ADG79038.1 dephospho-CoA kinase [Tsukamurella paurometabola DSM 20162]SUP33854.1 Dephospho-CoA kinase [Tsukamurella paurometabola]
MLRIGLTGGIGAGKSTVAKELASLGAVIVDGDKIAREVVEPGTPGLAALVEAFGEQILAADGSLDRPALAAIAFSDDESRATLNAITHPLVGARSQELITDAGPDAVIVQDIPLLVENQAAPMFHLVIIVWVDAQERVRRLVGSRGMAEEDARARIAAQATDEQRRAVADIWLENTGTEDETRAAVRELWATRIVPFAANVNMHRPAENAPELDDPGYGERLAGRLWVTLGADAKSVTTDGADARVVLAEGVAEDAVIVRLGDAGFAQVEPGFYRGSDPGRAVAVRVGTQAGAGTT